MVLVVGILWLFDIVKEILWDRKLVGVTKTVAEK